MILDDKRILLGVTGSISAFKAASVASKLTQLGALVDVVLTANGAKLVGPATFEGVTHRRCHTDTFADCADLSASHVTLGSQADLAMVAPCSANMLAKIAHGIADDKLSTTMLAVRCPVVIAPAMNCFMYENAATQANIATLRARGMTVVEPATGNLACGYTAKGRLPEPDELVEIALRHLAMPKLLEGRRVLVTAGATREFLDGVRCLTNPSTGKMGYACARAAAMAGAEVTVVAAPTSAAPPLGIRTIPVVSAHDMAQAVFAEFDRTDIVIMAAAVSDFTPATRAEGKIHKEQAALTVEFARTVDILAELGRRRRPDQFLCGFCMETAALIERASHKLIAKNLDMIVANDLTAPGCGFAVDTNGVTILTRDGSRSLDVADKLDIAMEIVRDIAGRVHP